MDEQVKKSHNNTADIKNSASSFIGIFVTVVCAYLCALSCLPSSGIFSALPICAVLSVAASFLWGKKEHIYAAMFFFPVVISALYKFSMARSITAGVLCLASAYFAILAKRAVMTFLFARKTKVEKAAFKSIALAVLSVIVCVLIWLIGFGNPFSLISCKNTNEKYIKDNYGSSVKIGSTYYDTFSGRYLTEISFMKEQTGKRYYVDKGRRDDFREYHFKEIVKDSVFVFSNAAAVDESIIHCYFDENSYIFTGYEDTTAYFDIMEYYIDKKDIVVNNEDLYGGTLQSAVEDPLFPYKRVIISAKDVDGNTRYAVKNRGDDVEFFTDDSEIQMEIDKKFR